MTQNIINAVILNALQVTFVEKPSKTLISIRQISIQSFMPLWPYLPQLLWKDGHRP